jgi:hypothetical protein
MIGFCFLIFLRFFLLYLPPGLWKPPIPIWTKIKIIPQTELECGARVCLHGLCLALSTYNSSRIMNNITRVRNLAARSRTMISNICNDGQWTSQAWLTSIIGPQQTQPALVTTASTLESSLEY